MTAQTRSDSLEQAFAATGEFQLSLPAGDVRIQAHDEEAIRVRELDGQALDELFDIEAQHNRLALRAREHLRFGRSAGDSTDARLRIELPRGAGVTIDAASSDIVAIGLVGRQRYKTASGDVRISDAAGSIGIDAVSGDIRIDAVANVELTAKAVSGDVDVRGGSLSTATITTTSGDIQLDTDLPGPGPYAIQTVSGDASTRQGPTLRVEAKTLTGQIGDALLEAFGGRGSRRSAGGTGPVLSFKSVSGDLQLTDTPPASGAAASHGAPEPPAPEPPAPEPAVDAAEPDRLAILRELEDGLIDVGEAAARLAELDEPDA
jgi:hypothetical protein